MPEPVARTSAEAGAGIRVVDLDEVPLDRVLALLRLTLGEGPLGRTAAAFRWKHREGPFGPSPGLVAIAPDGTLAGVRLFQRWRLACGGAELPAVRAVDTATHPAWRRRGIFRRLTLELVERLGAEGAALVFNTPNPRSLAGYRTMGWRSLGRVPLWVRPLRPGRIARSLLRRRASAAITTTATAVPPPGTEPVCALLADPAARDLLDRPWGDEPRLHTPRTAGYLCWRYGELPIADPDPTPGGVAAPVYGACWCVEGGDGAALIVHRRERGGLAELLLCEVLAHGARGEELAAGLVGELAAASGADYLAAVAAAGTPERRALTRAGFLPAGRRGPHLVVRELAAPPSGSPAPADLAAWRLSAGDLELF